jgi:hypothetical protein
MCPGRLTDIGRKKKDRLRASNKLRGRVDAAKGRALCLRRNIPTDRPALSSINFVQGAGVRDMSSLSSNGRFRPRLAGSGCNL